ncbi:MAG: hypothetical protein IJ008_01975 [Clostridia bacterium]|nr:hypothetical protein [Clostridia bacterium]
MAKKKILKSLTVLGAAALLVLGLTGCSSALDKQEEIMSTNVCNMLNSSQIVNTITDAEFDKYTFLASDFKDDGSAYVVDINGIGSYNNEQNKAYVSLQYRVGKEEFASVDSKKAEQVVEALNSVIQKYEMQKFSFAPMSNINEFNKQMGNVFESPVNGFRHCQSLTYKVDNIQYNEEKGYVSFCTTANTKYSKTTTEMRYMLIGTDSNGKPKMGWRVVPVTHYENFNQDHEIYLRATPEEIAAMKNDPSKIFDKFIEVVKSDNKNAITVRSVEINNDKLFNDNSGYTMER